MYKIAFIILGLLLLSNNYIFAQCNSGPLKGNLAPILSTFQKIALDSNSFGYYEFKAVYGRTYTFSLCDSGGHFIGDPNLSITNQRDSVLAFNDNYCELSSKMEWVCFKSGLYKLYICGTTDQSNRASVLAFASTPFIPRTFSNEPTAFDLRLDTTFCFLESALNSHSSFINSIPNRNTISDSILNRSKYNNGINNREILLFLESFSKRNFDIQLNDRGCYYYLVDHDTEKSYYRNESYRISFISNTADSLSPFALSKLILYYGILLDPGSINRGLDYYSRRALANNLADLYNTYYNYQNVGHEEWYEMALEQPFKLVTPRIFDSTIVRDVANIISGPEGKLKASKVDLKFIAPGISLSIPVLTISKKLSIQAGGGIEFKEPVTEIVNKKPNFDMKLNTELVYMPFTRFKFSSCRKKDYVRVLYSPGFRNNPARRDSLMMNAPWNSKNIIFFTGNIVGKWQRLNMIDSNNNLTDTAAQHSSGAIKLSVNLQYYHYVSPFFKFLTKGGNKYLKLGFDMSYNNAVANETATGVKVQAVDTTADGEKSKVSKEQIAYNELDVIDKHFTFSPHFDYYVMENTRHFGVHLLSEIKMIHLGAGTWDNQLKLGIGLFGSVKNSLSANGNVVNFELLFTSQNPIHTNISTYWKSFVPVLKLEFPFNQLKN